jgi:hypothetical protein
MGNKLESIKYALGQGLTGVAKPTKTLEAVDNFVEDVEAWKKNIDDQRLKLKTDTATKVREAEKEAYANLPNTKTERDLVIQGLANYKDMLYNNMSMVQNGVLKPEDNLIFQENGKQSFEIAADLINNYSTRKEQAMKEASGYYDDEGNFVEPTAGDYQAALQRINDEFMIPGGQEFKFMSNGMGNITMFKTKIDEETKTKVLDLDADGNPIPIDGQSNIPMLAFMDERNTKAPMFVLANEVTKLTRGKDSLMGAAYEEFIEVKGLLGSVKDNMSQSPGFQETVKQATSSLTNTVPKVVSMLADNGPDAQQTTTLTPSEWDALSDAQKNETISFEYTALDGSTKKGVKSKYLQVKLATNNSFVAVLSERDQLAAEQIAQTALISSLEQTIDPGVKVGDFAPQRDNASDIAQKELKKEKVGRVEFSKRLALGGEEADKALEEMNQSGLYTLEKGYNQILSKSAVQEITIDGDTRMAEVYRVQTPSGPRDTYVYHTTKDGENIPLRERTRQTLAIMMTNPTETKDLFDTYISEGNKFEENYKVENFRKRDKVSSVNIRLSLDTTTGGTGNNKSTLGDDIAIIADAADSASLYGSDNAVLASGLQSSLQQALLNSGQNMQSAPKVTNDGTTIKITAVNSDGKNITVSGTVDDSPGIDASTIETQAKALVTEFLSNINSDQNYSSRKGKYDD